MYYTESPITGFILKTVARKISVLFGASFLSLTLAMVPAHAAKSKRDDDEDAPAKTSKSAKSDVHAAAQKANKQVKARKDDDDEDNASNARIAKKPLKQAKVEQEDREDRAEKQAMANKKAQSRKVVAKDDDDDEEDNAVAKRPNSNKKPTPVKQQVARKANNNKDDDDDEDNNAADRKQQAKKIELVKARAAEQAKERAAEQAKERAEEQAKERAAAQAERAAAQAREAKIRAIEQAKEQAKEEARERAAEQARAERLAAKRAEARVQAQADARAQTRANEMREQSRAEARMAELRDQQQVQARADAARLAQARDEAALQAQAQASRAEEVRAARAREEAQAQAQTRAREEAQSQAQARARAEEVRAARARDDQLAQAQAQARARAVFAQREEEQATLARRKREADERQDRYNTARASMLQNSYDAPQQRQQYTQQVQYLPQYAPQQYAPQQYAPQQYAPMPPVQQYAPLPQVQQYAPLSQGSALSRVLPGFPVGGASGSGRSFGHQAGLHGMQDELDLKSSVALVVDQETNEVLLGKNQNAVLPIASITKLMTGLLISEAKLSMDEVITISQEDVDTEKNSSSRLRVGTQLSRGELLHLALMASENRAANALGRTYPGGLSRFVALMNSKAQSLGMRDTRYIEPTGLSSSNQSSAQDLALLVNTASYDPLLREFTTSPSHQVYVGNRMMQFNTTNGLIKNPEWDIGLQKTGYISEAGRCMVMQAKIAGRKLIMVFLDSAGKFSRMADAERVKRWVESTLSGQRNTPFSLNKGNNEPLNPRLAAQQYANKEREFATRY